MSETTTTDFDPSALSDYEHALGTLIALAVKAQMQVDTYSGRPGWNPNRRPSQAVMVAERDSLVTAITVVGGRNREGTGFMRHDVEDEVRRIARLPQNDTGFRQMAESALPLIEALRRFRDTGEHRGS